MATRLTLAAARSLAGATVLASLIPAAAFAQAPAGTAASAVFTSRIEEYARLRGRLEEPLPALDEKRGARPAMLTRRYLASAIRAARPRARAATVFAPPVGDAFRHLIAQRLSEVDPEGLRGWDEDLGVDIMVYEPVPAWSRLPIPDEWLGVFPELPDGIEYRMVNGALVLWDLHAEIVIDVLPSVFVLR
jgi:hypothetical protein